MGRVPNILRSTFTRERRGGVERYTLSRMLLPVLYGSNVIVALLVIDKHARIWPITMQIRTVFSVAQARQTKD